MDLIIFKAVVRFDLLITDIVTGTEIAASTAIIAMTTSSSMRVKPLDETVGESIFCVFIGDRDSSYS